MKKFIFTLVIVCASTMFVACGTKCGDATATCSDSCAVDTVDTVMVDSTVCGVTDSLIVVD